MRNLVSLHGVVVFSAAILFIPLLGQASDVRLRDDPNVLRADVVKIEPETVRDWVSAKRGTEISIPWFDGSLTATIERVEETGVEGAGKFMMVIAEVEAGTIGNVVLTIGDDIAGEITFTGAITIDTEGYRLRSLGGDAYSLVQFDTGQLMPTTPDSDDPDAVQAGHYMQPQLRESRPSVGALPPRQLFSKLNAQLDWGPGFFESGLWIDILVAFSNEAADWATANGYNISAEILTMIENTNLGLADSGIDSRLRLVGVAHVEYSVMDSAKLIIDRDDLKNGVGTLDVLHTLRDLLRADVVSLLVFNGTQPCGTGKACGRSITSNRLAGPGDVPGSSDWEVDFASKGFNVVSVYHAINADTFMHEVGHNLGAQHDWYYYLTAPPHAAPADLFAHGWAMTDIAKPARTVMTYNNVCKKHVPKLDCELLPVFSNPLRTHSTARTGDPAPGNQSTLLGPADNARAINRMAQTVSSYRLALPTP
jgi:hypothetical protein